MDSSHSGYKNTTAVIGVAITIMFPLILSMFLIAYMPGDETKLIWSRVMFWVEVALMAFYAAKVEKQPFIIWNQNNYNILFYIKWVVLLYLFGIAAAIIASIPQLFGVRDNTAVLTHWVGIVVQKWWLMILAAVTAGITEELLFRGYLLTRLQQLFNNRYGAVIVSALIFSNLHYKYYSLRETIFSFLIGLVLAIHYQRYKNIHVLIIVHFIIDIVAFLLARQRLGIFK